MCRVKYPNDEEEEFATAHKDLLKRVHLDNGRLMIVITRMIQVTWSEGDKERDR